MKINIVFTAIALASAASFLSCGSDSNSGSQGRPALGDMIDRSGRAAISTALISPFEGDDDAKTAAKNGYNQAAKESWSDYTANIAGNVAIYDAVVGNCGDNSLTNPDGATAAGAYTGFATALADDQLYIDSTKRSCNQYLAQELNILLDAGIEECGGRTPTMDIVETSYSALTAGAATGVDDTISADDKRHSNTDFPFLAAP